MGLNPIKIIIRTTTIYTATHKSTTTPYMLLCCSAAAIKIQRAWLRNKGLYALGQRLECDCLDNMRDDTALDTVNPGFLIQPENIVVYKLWLLKLFIRSGIPNAAELSSNHCLVVCWFVSVHKERWQQQMILNRDDDDDSTTPLALAADNLVTGLLNFLQGDYKHIRDLDEDVRDFVDVFTAWRLIHSQQFNIRLRHSVIETIYGLVRHTTTPASELVRFKRLTALYAVMDPGARNFKTSPVYKSIVLASGSSFWTPYISQAKFVHALLIDDKFIVSVDKSIPELQSKHTSSADGQIVDSKALRDDLMSTMIGSVEDAATLERIANVFHETDKDPPAEFSSKVIEILVDILSDTPFAARINSVWEKLKDSRPLMALVFSVRVLRNMLDNAAVNFVRHNMGVFAVNDNPTTAAFAVMQVAEHEQTLKWIGHCIKMHDPELVKALSDGNPFALLEFFNQSVIDMVVVLIINNNHDPPSVDFLTENSVPEFLRLDRERLVDIRLDLSTCKFEPKHFVELVNSGKWMPSSSPQQQQCPPSAVQQSADKLRRILQLDRFFHGQSICRYVVEMATKETMLWR